MRKTISQPDLTKRADDRGNNLSCNANCWNVASYLYHCILLINDYIGSRDLCMASFASNTTTNCLSVKPPTSSPFFFRQKVECFLSAIADLHSPLRWPHFSFHPLSVDRSTDHSNDRCRLQAIGPCPYSCMDIQAMFITSMINPPFDRDVLLHP